MDSNLITEVAERATFKFLWANAHHRDYRIRVNSSQSPAPFSKKRIFESKCSFTEIMSWRQPQLAVGVYALTLVYEVQVRTETV